MTALEDIFEQELGRSSDPAGLDFYQQQLSSGVPIERIRSIINDSSEGRAFDQRLPTAAVGPQPQIGLSGAEVALQGGLTGGLAALEEGSGRSAAATQLAAQQFSPFSVGGGQAANSQAALSGALGPQAQRDAISTFQRSPNQEFMRDRSERALLRNSAAVGGLGGANVLKALQQNAIGLAGQDFDRNFQRLGDVAQRGIGVAGARANLFGQQAGIQSGLGQQAGQMAFGTGQQLAGGRTRAAEQIGQQTIGASQRLAELQRMQGAGLADITGSGGGNIANLLSGAGQAQGGSNQQLAALLANIATGQGSTIAGLPGIPGSQQTPGRLGQIGQAASGIGAVMALSDRRLKTNITKIGKTKAGLNLYKWDWKKPLSQISIGVMADEAAKLFPAAVNIGPDGFMRVDYARIG